MMRFLILIVVFLQGVVFASTAELVKKGANIVDIGKTHGYNEILVPFSIIQYEPTLQQVANVVQYEHRHIEKDNCIIDGLNHESCPIDKKACDAQKEYTQGAASRGEGYMSCSRLDPASYFDPNTGKCVLPADKAKVCQAYSGSYYDGGRDKCVTGNQYRADPVSSTITSRWWHCDKGCGCALSCHPEFFLDVVKAAGGTYVKKSGTFEVDIGIWTVSYNKIVHDAKHPFTIWVAGGRVLTINPGDYFGVGYKVLVNKSGTLSSSSIDKPYIYARTTTTTYPCQSGYTPFLLNGEHWCTNEALYDPSCSHNQFFPQRDRDICMGDKKKYTFYTYSCPTDVNVYDNEWNIVDPGGDCGENNLATDTDGDGINDQCNSPVPDPHNCERTTYRCSFDPNAVCVLDESIEDYNDFTKWTVYNWNDLDTASDWEVLAKNSVIQHKNGWPTFFLSNYEMQDGLITMEGTFKTDDPTDNDWFGFVFGMKDETHYYLLDWSRWKNDNYNKVVDGEYINRDANGNPINGAIPLTLAKIDGLTSYSPLWNHTDSGTAYKVLQRKDNGGWTSGQEYKIRLEISRNDIKAWIGKVGEEMHLDIDYHSDVALDITGKLGFYNFSISKVTYKDFRIEWEDGKDITKITKRPLVNPADWIGRYRPGDFGALYDGFCPDSSGQCANALSSIEGFGNKLCLTSKSGDKGCFEAQGSCLFSGYIHDTGILEKPIFSFLNSPDEVIPGYDAKYKVDHDSPTGISLDFEDLGSSSYDIGQIKSQASSGDQITVDFWMYWQGDGNGMPIGFDRYDLWISTENSKPVMGFNTAQGDVYGIGDISWLKNSWHRITAVFTQNDILKNELYIDGVKQELSEQRLSRTYHNNANADITKPFQLSGWNANDNYALDAKVAGVNVYDWRLGESEVSRLVSGGDFSGISRLKINPYSIVGYDANNTFLGEINSTCRLSGKVGFLGRYVDMPKNTGGPKQYYAFGMTIPYQEVNTTSCMQKDNIVTFFVKNKNEVLSATLSETMYTHWVAVWVNDNLVYTGPENGDRLSQLWGAGGSQLYESKEACLYSNANQDCYPTDTVRYAFDGEGQCSSSSNRAFQQDIDIAPYIKDGTNTIKIRTIGDNTVGSGVSFRLYASAYNVRCQSGCSLFTEDPSIIIPPQEMVSVLTAPPIMSAKVIDNRIEFWSSYNRVGSNGFIEVMKEVLPQDKESGYKYEFEELDGLYQSGFTAFKSVNNMTYATSAEPMDLQSCQSLLSGTHYYLAERNASDLLGLDMINSLSHYLDGRFGDYCIIQRVGNYDNWHAKYATRKEIIENTLTAYFCSPWSCESHQCGKASCANGFYGNIIKDKDRDTVLGSPICIDQECDINNDYFTVCGNKTGCEDDPSVYPQENGTCMKATCDGDGVFNPKTGKCEKYGCKDSIERDGKCYKSL